MLVLGPTSPTSPTSESRHQTRDSRTAVRLFVNWDFLVGISRIQMTKDVVIRNRISGKLKQQSRAGGSNRAIRPKLLTPFWLTLMSFQVSRGKNMLSPKCQYHLQWSLLLPSQSTQLIFLNRDHLDDYPGIHPFILHQRTPFHIPEINIYAYCLLSKPSTICHLSFCFS